MTEEIKVWQGHSSQILNLNIYIISGVLTIISFGWLALVFGPLCIWKYFEVKNQKYVLTNQRLTMYSGVFSRVVDELELYRVKDTQFLQPFFLRLFSLGNIMIISTDQTTHVVIIRAVANAHELREQIRNLVEDRREQRNVRMTEIE